MKRSNLSMLAVMAAVLSGTESDTFRQDKSPVPTEPEIPKPYNNHPTSYKKRPTTNYTRGSADITKRRAKNKLAKKAAKVNRRK